MLIEELLTKNLRISERQLLEERKTQIESFKDMLVVKSGKTVIYLGYSKLIREPYSDGPGEGIFNIYFEKGKKNDIFLNTLTKVYLNSKCVDLYDLCIKYGKEVYAVIINIYVLVADGNIIKACIDGINRILKELNIKTYFEPKAYYFASVANKILLDPDAQEAQIATWNSQVIMKSTREILLIDKKGEGIDANTMLSLLNCAFELTASK